MVDLKSVAAGVLALCLTSVAAIGGAAEDAPASSAVPGTTRNPEDVGILNRIFKNVAEEVLARADEPTLKPSGTTIGDPDADPDEPAPPPKKKWYEKIGLRGYTQFLLNEVLSEDDDSAPPQHVSDRSLGDNQSFLVRRARFVFSGDVSEHLSIYIQPDFVTTTPGSSDATNFTQLRDVYADVHVDTDRVHRFRVGLSKVPYGWENLQSSQNRIPLDRNDAFNSATPNERDLGIFYYWTPKYAQDLFKLVMDENLKGSGNYGIFGIGIYNGQGGSFQEQNDNFHVVSRLTVPYQFPNGQIVEVGAQGLFGNYSVFAAEIRALGAGDAIEPEGTIDTGNRKGISEERYGGSFILYPQPIGIQGEWTFGRGPTLNREQTRVVESDLDGGYVQLFYKLDDFHGSWFPFVRYNRFEGGYRSQRNAPDADIEEFDFGVEWQMRPEMELAVIYSHTDRTNTSAMSGEGDVSYRQFEGEVLRMQFQINY